MSVFWWVLAAGLQAQMSRYFEWVMLLVCFGDTCSMCSDLIGQRHPLLHHIYHALVCHKSCSVWNPSIQCGQTEDQEICSALLQRIWNGNFDPCCLAVIEILLASLYWWIPWRNLVLGCDHCCCDVNCFFYHGSASIVVLEEARCFPTLHPLPLKNLAFLNSFFDDLWRKRDHFCIQSTNRLPVQPAHHKLDVWGGDNWDRNHLTQGDLQGWCSLLDRCICHPSSFG